MRRRERTDRSGGARLMVLLASVPSPGDRRSQPRSTRDVGSGASCTVSRLALEQCWVPANEQTPWSRPGAAPLPARVSLPDPAPPDGSAADSPVGTSRAAGVRFSGAAVGSGVTCGMPCMLCGMDSGRVMKGGEAMSWCTSVASVTHRAMAAAHAQPVPQAAGVDRACQRAIASTCVSRERGRLTVPPTLAVALDSTRFRSWDPTLFTEWHSRYGGRASWRTGTWSGARWWCTPDAPALGLGCHGRCGQIMQAYRASQADDHDRSQSPPCMVSRSPEASCRSIASGLMSTAVPSTSSPSALTALQAQGAA